MHLDVPNGSDPVNSKLIRIILVGWILLQTAVLVLVCTEIARII